MSPCQHPHPGSQWESCRTAPGLQQYREKAVARMAALQAWFPASCQGERSLATRAWSLRTPAEAGCSCSSAVSLRPGGKSQVWHQWAQLGACCWRSCLAMGKDRQSTAIYCQAPGLQTLVGGHSKPCLALFFLVFGSVKGLFETL